MSTPTESTARQAAKDAVARVGIMEFCRITGLARWTVRRLIRGRPVNPGTIHQVAAKLTDFNEAGVK